MAVVDETLHTFGNSDGLLTPLAIYTRNHFISAVLSVVIRATLSADSAHLHPEQYIYNSLVIPTVSV